MSSSDDRVAANVAQWTLTNAEFTDAAAETWWRNEAIKWGVFGIADEWLGDVTGLDVVELGCGTAHCSARLARAGARPVGVDPTPVQLATARRMMQSTGIDFRLSRRLPSRCRFQTTPSTWRSQITVRRSGPTRGSGLRKQLGCCARVGPVVSTTSSLAHLCTPEEDEVAIENVLVRPRFAPWEVEWPGYQGVEYHLSHGDWIRVLVENGFVLDALHELQPGPTAQTHEYYYVIPVEWARRWPGEDLWEAHLR